MSEIYDYPASESETDKCDWVNDIRPESRRWPQAGHGRTEPPHWHLPFTAATSFRSNAVNAPVKNRQPWLKKTSFWVVAFASSGGEREFAWRLDGRI